MQWQPTYTMKSVIRHFFCVFAFGLNNCNQSNEKSNLKDIVLDKVEKPKFVPNEKFLATHSDTCGCSAQFELKDSVKFVHIKGQFYKSATGHLYEKTVGLKEINGHLVDQEYFNGYFSQEVDPLTFEPLEGWYAKDKNFVYYYRPVSGGMQILKMDKADPKTFNLLAGHYKYAMDKSFFYKESEIVKDFVPGKTRIQLDKKGRVFKMTCNNKTYRFETVK